MEQCHAMDDISGVRSRFQELCGNPILFYTASTGIQAEMHEIHKRKQNMIPTLNGVHHWHRPTGRSG